MALAVSACRPSLSLLALALSARDTARAPFPCLGPSRPRLTCLSARPVESREEQCPFGALRKGAGRGALLVLRAVWVSSKPSSDI